MHGDGLYIMDVSRMCERARTCTSDNVEASPVTRSIAPPIQWGSNDDRWLCVLRREMLTLIPLPDVDEPRRPRRPARERKARYRQRQASGVATCSVEYDGTVIDFLVRTEWLGEREACDRKAVGAAIARMLRDSAARR